MLNCLRAARSDCFFMQINILDIILVLSVAACIVAGYFKGLLRSVISFAKYAVGIPLAFFTADKYSAQVYNSFFREIGERPSRCTGSSSVSSHSV